MRLKGRVKGIQGASSSYLKPLKFSGISFDSFTRPWRSWCFPKRPWDPQEPPQSSWYAFEAPENLWEVLVLPEHGIYVALSVLYSTGYVLYRIQISEREGLSFFISEKDFSSGFERKYRFLEKVKQILKIIWDLCPWNPLRLPKAPMRPPGNPLEPLSMRVL